jgi:hypothetical protein
VGPWAPTSHITPSVDEMKRDFFVRFFDFFLRLIDVFLILWGIRFALERRPIHGMTTLYYPPLALDPPSSQQSKRYCVLRALIGSFIYFFTFISRIHKHF